MTSSQILTGLGLTIFLAIACQIAATRYRLPAIILLLPVGFVAGALSSDMNPENLLGPAFSPLVGLAVAVILFEGGLDLDLRQLEGHVTRVVRRLLYLGIPVTFAGAAALGGLLLGLSGRAAVMLGAILIVSGPTVVAPLLAASRPGPRVSTILNWEGITIDPIGAIIGVLVFEALQSHVGLRPGLEVVHFLTKIAIGVAAGAIGAGVLWLALGRLQLTGVLATEAVLGTVLATAALSDAFREDTGLVAALTMGVAVANLPHFQSPEDRPFFKTIVQLVVGLLFISISASVTPTSLDGVAGPSLLLVVLLVVVVRPLVAALATWRTDLARNERVFIGAMDPRGIIAASTAATFTAPLVAIGIPGAQKLLPATFVVIVGTVAIYGLGAVPLARALGLETPLAPGDRPAGLDGGQVGGEDDPTPAGPAGGDGP